MNKKEANQKSKRYGNNNGPLFNKVGKAETVRSFLRSKAEDGKRFNVLKLTDKMEWSASYGKKALRDLAKEVSVLLAIDNKGMVSVSWK